VKFNYPYLFSQSTLHSEVQMQIISVSYRHADILKYSNHSIESRMFKCTLQQKTCECAAKRIHVTESSLLRFGLIQTTRKTVSASASVQKVIQISNEQDMTSEVTQLQL